MPTSFRQIINKAVDEKRFLVVPGAHDALSARLIQQIGFETYFIGGFPAVGARYGVPDVGLKGFGEISAAVRDIMTACDLPVFVDGDDGYGDVKNVVHTVQTYERMGVSRHPDRRPAMAEALRPHGRQEGRSHRTGGGQDQGGVRGAHQSGDLDSGAHRRARRLRPRRGHAPRRALHPRRRRRHLHRGAALASTSSSASAKHSTCRKSAIR